MKHFKSLFIFLVYCLLSAFSADTASEYTTQTITANAATTTDVVPGATNSILQSKDGGQTWEDISQGLPHNEQPEDFFAGESDVYLRVGDVTYRSKSNLKAPVWEIDGQSWKQVQNEDGVGDFVESEGVLVATGSKGIMRSTDKGEHWEWVVSEGGVGIAVERIEGGFAAISFNTTTQSRRIRISMDGGKTWKAIDEGLQPSLFTSSIVQSGKYLLCGHPDGIFSSPDMGRTWNIVHPSADNVPKISIPGMRNNPGRVFRLYVSGNVVYAVAGSAGC